METTDSVKEYYGKVLQKSQDLKTNACCTGAAPPDFIRRAMKNVHEEVSSKYYGCGLVMPADLKGLRILDLGSGSGRDVYVLAQMVGEEGFVMGVDMTDEQLAVANAHKEWHREKFGFKTGNVEFKKGFIERLDELGLEDNSFDIVVSNCVINLSCDKEAVLREVFRILKPGGELYFSDVYSDRRIPEDLRQDPVLWGECLSGALYWNDFLRLAKQSGFTDPRLVEDSVITIGNKEIEKKIGHFKFFSATYRLFKIPALETDCEDYGQAVIYQGTIENHPYEWKLDRKHVFRTGDCVKVCGNSWLMLEATRFGKHFRFIGDFSTHFGIYADCGKGLPFESASESTPSKGGSCC